MDNLRIYRLTLTIILTNYLVNCESLMGGHLDNQKTTTTESPLSRKPHHHHVPGIVPFAFNGGQPFSLEKDPVTGQINFDNGPPLKALNLTSTYDTTDDHDDNEDIELLRDKIDNAEEHPNEINQYSPSFHDFLNLPVRYSDHEKYTSDKYPLISNSYANTKVQGGSSYKIYDSLNHKSYHSGKASTSQSYSNTRTPYVQRTTTTQRPTTTTTTTITTKPPKPTTTTARSTIVKKSSPPQLVTTWKPRPIDRYEDEYDLEAMLPIEKIQNSGTRGDQPFVSFPKFDYEDNYDDYLPQDSPEENKPTTTTTTTTTTPMTTTTMKTTTTTTTPKPTTTTTTTTTEETIPAEIERTTQSQLISVKTPNSNNGIVNGHQNYPSYSGLVIESSSNVIVPPDQDTISFVLGNRQNVQGSYYGHGSAIPESPYGDEVTLPNRMDSSYFDQEPITSPPRENSPSRDTVGFQTKPEPQAPSNFKFPRDPPNFQTPPPYPNDSQQKWWFNSEESEKSQSLPENDKDNRVNVVAGYRVAFPSEPPQSTTFSPATTSENPGLSELPDILVPPAADKPVRPPVQPQRPLYYPPHHHYHSRPLEIPPRIQRLPMNPNYKIRPPMDLNLPNILPQFRPNVKTSQRRGSEAIGTMIISNSPNHPPRVSVRPPIHPPTVHRPPPRRSTPVSHLQRLKPPPPPPPPPIHALRLPSPEALVDTDHVIHPKDGPIRRNVGVDGLIDERNRGSQIIKSRLNDEATDKLEAPPQPPIFFKRKTTNETRVATLQMIQHHGVDIKAGEAQNDETGESQGIDRIGDSPVFVVYPVKGAIDIHGEPSEDSDVGNADESVVIGTHGPQRPLPPDTLSQQDQEMSVILPIKSDFPYPLERPDPSLFVREKPLLVPSDSVADDDGEESFAGDKDTSINLIPYLQDHVPYSMKQNAISTTLHIGANPLASSLPPVTPIAYVYTPTVRDQSSEVYEKSPILLPSQQPSSSSSSAPSPQSFMAPFVASLSAEAPSRNGWSVVTLNPSSKSEETEKRVGDSTESRIKSTDKGGNSTAGDDDEKNSEVGVQTEASDFDPENFKPQLFGGFQPIFEFPSDSAEIPSDLKNEEAVGIMDKPRGLQESPSPATYET